MSDKPKEPTPDEMRKFFTWYGAIGVVVAGVFIKCALLPIQRDGEEFLVGLLFCVVVVLWPFLVMIAGVVGAVWMLGQLLATLLG